MKEYRESSFSVLGAGRSGIAAARLLNRKGAKVFLSDENKREKLKYFDEGILKKEGIKFEIGSHSDRVFESDAIIKSPGIFPYNEILIRAKKQGIKIYSEIETAYWYCSAPVIAITGTNGKTTTTELTGEIFRNAGKKTYVCGNVGTAFSEIADEAEEDSVVVLEVSSFQLNDIEHFRPRVAVILNITPDHIDWHKNFENYMRAKLNITKNQQPGDLTVINFDDKTLREADTGKAGKAYFSIRENLIEKDASKGSFEDKGDVVYFDKEKSIEEKLMKTGDINIRGRHNLYNSLSAIISARAFEIKNDIITDTLREFKGVEHRIEFVRELKGASYYNDSKATNIDSLIVALESFSGNIILILGGREKDNDYSRIKKIVAEKVKTIIAIGETKEKIFNFFNDTVKTVKADSMKQAVLLAENISGNGDIVLLSPACKSFDMYDNYEMRGKDFKNEVMSLS